MKALSTEHRRQLEKTVVSARDVAEEGARVSLEALAVHHHEPYGFMGSEQRALRRRLRAHARHLGDRVNARSGSHATHHLVHECAYEKWHGMLFARFLAENHLLIEPETGVAITLDECDDLAKEAGTDKWTQAARFAHGMLPQVFRPDHPVFGVRLAPEYRLKLEGLVEKLPAEIFAATDALGWVYQFWQTKKKDEVNRSEVKIGAHELPALTQLFTEPYMVQFLLHNSLGAWWVSRHSDKACPVVLSHLRRTRKGIPTADTRESISAVGAEGSVPAAGIFEGWPDHLSEFRLLDPCCGSGHFLVAAFLMLVPMRMALEDLDSAEAVDAVLRENLHGLEPDKRCVAIAAFALALEAWRYPGAGGFRSLPTLNLAWCGQPVAGTPEQWRVLAGGDVRLEAGMTALYDTFREAPLLGSLIDPTRSVREDMLTAGFGDLQPLLEKALQEYAGEEEWEETAIAALGLTEATRLLSDRYHLVATNVPYLGRGKQNEPLRTFSEAHYPEAKGDLANVFLERCLEFSRAGGRGVTQIVMPQNWLFQISYRAQRKRLLKAVRWELLARLGPNAFETISGEVVNVILLTLTHARPHAKHRLHSLDASEPRSPQGKDALLRDGPLDSVSQASQLRQADARVTLAEPSGLPPLETVAGASQGLATGDSPRLRRFFWEFEFPNHRWRFLQSTVSKRKPMDYGGRESVVDWDHDGMLLASRSGRKAWGKRGVAVSQMRSLPATLYTGELFDNNVCPIVPKHEGLLEALWAYCSSEAFQENVRLIDKKIQVTSATLVKVPFDEATWTRMAATRFPQGIPRPQSHDPTQWIFHGHVVEAEDVLQVGTARMLGYRWPAETDPDMELANEQRERVSRCTDLYPFEDGDGIVCLPSVRGEQPAHERLLHVLHAAYGDNWHDGILTKLLAESGSASLDVWLRNRFFEEHCTLFHHRPFIWHVWDGRKQDGFHALINYHKLVQADGRGRRLLESLTYSYLGDWITRQRDGVKRGRDGAEDRLAAALELRKRLVAILDGTTPFDLFIRWKSLEEQPIGWEPDVNDGVRLNIRPFMARDLPSGRKGAGILRTKPNVHWRKDRAKEPARDETQFPWFWKDGGFTGERVNDVHLEITEKREARKRVEGGRP